MRDTNSQFKLEFGYTFFIGILSFLLSNLFCYIFNYLKDKQYLIYIILFSLGILVTLFFLIKNMIKKVKAGSVLSKSYNIVIIIVSLLFISFISVISILYYSQNKISIEILLNASENLFVLKFVFIYLFVIGFLMFRKITINMKDEIDDIGNYYKICVTSFYVISILIFFHSVAPFYMHDDFTFLDIGLLLFIVFIRIFNLIENNFHKDKKFNLISLIIDLSIITLVIVLSFVLPTLLHGLNLFNGLLGEDHSGELVVFIIKIAVSVFFIVEIFLHHDKNVY